MAKPIFKCAHCSATTELDFDPTETLYAFATVNNQIKKTIKKNSGRLKWQQFVCPSCGKPNN